MGCRCGVAKWRNGEMAKWRNGVWLGLSSASAKERQKLREEGIEPPTAGTGIQRSTTELFPHANNYYHTNTNTQHTHTNMQTHIHTASPCDALETRRHVGWSMCACVLFVCCVLCVVVLCCCVVCMCCVLCVCVVVGISPYSSVVEHSLRKRKVGGSIPPGGYPFPFYRFTYLPYPSSTHHRCIHHTCGHTRIRTQHIIDHADRSRTHLPATTNRALSSANRHYPAPLV
jgi:hypothetical protein